MLPIHDVAHALLALCEAQQGALISAYEITWNQYTYRWLADRKEVGFRLPRADNVADVRRDLEEAARRWRESEPWPAPHVEQKLAAFRHVARDLPYSLAEVGEKVA